MKTVFQDEAKSQYFEIYAILRLNGNQKHLQTLSKPD